ncbi:MAG: DNA-directed RNA polymerase subunit beta' [Parcubacteria group bacterium CG_4_9_14_0_2_um_filter_41_8]|nr:MAG: DNA-directed RNA polymerase subunit beta' [Parcubacteria group bacterium CG1_02_41_12]PIP66985.1 MAG: DNA-directed RNA polymerase subunit beta' [Parcubacteria group bacterium CG22_combo_CG10-13_8_21_14_all_41_9]PIQ80251.1 MAG: DNA-directed RNA polymerase subunit beta' [Parcubacteria group bacterium CG11_big_fil_rev_8_21_14_0_20_41_14]PIR56890.1 MAG: DNA-directed RNA polymerase subunit beta' [Parcubacteria group bacterium CG10_big_fil_rev_8_21_14_0_10_41_35]PJC40515.1 MAG: DNA-directed R
MSTPSTTRTFSSPQSAPRPVDFDAIRLRLASTDDIHRWSHGEVLKPETINYRTQKPEKDGLFDERIFGPTKDWECYCGKYKRIRYKGIVCDKCGVEVTRALVRRERMGHIDLSAPVSHIWFLRGVPSKIGLVLDLSVQELEKVIYFASFIITSVDEDKKKQLLEQVGQEYKSKSSSLEKEFKNALEQKQEALTKTGISAEALAQKLAKEKGLMQDLLAEKKEQLDNAFETAKQELSSLAVKQVVSESSYHDLSMKYGHIFDAGIGAEAIYELLKSIDLGTQIKEMDQQLEKAKGGRRKKLMRREKLLQSLSKTGIRPESMVLTVIPVIPPDLRPMVQLDGGRFATSDLNDLYRRVINRNNRLRRLKDLNAPEVIVRNEKRMLQEAVDALIDNSARHGKTVTASTGQRRVLRSIADMLKGKQGRFRQNLLGKRIDYSGRSVIVVGPKLKLHQCGLPKTMALELFKPFVISQLIKREIVHNVRSANRYIEAGHAEVWDILEEVTRDAHVFLNRAPTLHRLGIQAFQPVLIEGKAIHVHPLVCSAFNADFDGDQMAVHVPLTLEARREAKEIMLSSKNLLKPATGEPVSTPGLDIVFGCYYLTQLDESQPKYEKIFSSEQEAKLAYDYDIVSLHRMIKVKKDNEILETTVGRIMFNEVIPEKIGFVNEVTNKKSLKNITSQCFRLYGLEQTAAMLDDLMQLGFYHSTRSGMSWAMADLPELSEKKEMLSISQLEVDKIQEQYEEGLLTDDERHSRVIEIWARVKDEITQKAQNSFNNPLNPIYTMVESGARGSWGQTTQMMGMKGLVTSPSGATIELPVKANFKEGFDVLEYFISTHGARKGLTDTALRTANAGYLTRRLIDVAQDIIIAEDDCKDTEGWDITIADSELMGETIAERVSGRTVMQDIKGKRGKVIVKSGEMINYDQAEEIAKLDLECVKIRSVLSCKSRRGICAKCYGYDLGYNKPVELGTAAGIIAAQSIGEPGTQLTMRTFHTGGVASGQDITQGLPRVEEIFEARRITKGAIISEITGKVSNITDENGVRTITITAAIEQEEKYSLEEYSEENCKVDDKDKVKKGDVLFSEGDDVVNAGMDGTIKRTKKFVRVVSSAGDQISYIVPGNFGILVKKGEVVNQGDVLSEGSVDLHDLYELKGEDAAKKYVMKEIQNIYSSQGQKLNDKHLEIISRQIFSRVYIKEAGDTDFLPGEIVERAHFNSVNIDTKKEKKQQAIGEVLLLGVTKSSLSTESFLSAASFQETARVLIDAAITGKVDHLRGLKENVIIGRLIPAGTGFQKGLVK